MVPKSLERYVERKFILLFKIIIITINWLLLLIKELASGDLEQFIPVTIPGPSTAIEEIEIKVEGSGSRPPSSSRTSLSEEALSPPSHYFSDEDDDDDVMSDHEELIDSDVDIN